MSPAYLEEFNLPRQTDDALDRTAEVLAKLLSGSEDPDVAALSEAVKANLGITEPLPRTALASPSPGLSTLLMISNDQGFPGCYPRSPAAALFIPVPGPSLSLSYRTCP